VSRKLLSITCCLLVGLLPVQMVAADAVGVLTNSGTVLVDERQTGVGTAVFAGETVQTKAKARAVVTGKGRTVSLGENSTMRLGSKDLQLQSGSVVVTSSYSFATEIGGAKVITDPGIPTKFLARRIGDELKVVTLEGMVYVNDGQQTTPVPATKGVNVNVGSKTEKSHTDDYPGAKKTTWLTNDDIGILIVAGAAIVAGVTLGIVNAKNAQPATPTTVGP